MTYSEACVNLVKKSEGLRLTAYKCPAGVWTIGYGHTGLDVVEGMTITEEDASDFLHDDLHDAEFFVGHLVSVPLTQGQHDALVDFVFNLGGTALRKSTLLAKLNSGDYDGAEAELDKWVNGGGHVLPGLVARRNAEQELWA